MAGYVVRFGAMRILGLFNAPAGQEYRRGTPVIVRTNRGLEAGEVLCAATDPATAPLASSEPGQILREMTCDDANELARIRQHEEEEFRTCLRCIDASGLEMQLVDVEHLFGGE